MCHIIICRMRRGQETRLFGQGLQGFRVCRVCRLSDGIVAGCLRPNAPITGQVVPRCLQAHTLYTLSVHTLSAHTLSLRAHTLCAGINHIRHAANACQVFSAHTLSTHTLYTLSAQPSTSMLAGYIYIYVCICVCVCMHMCVCVCDDALPPPSQEPAALACCLFPASLCITSSYVHVSHHHMYTVSGLPMCHIII